MSYTAKDFSSSAEVRWCPGCGDHAILKHLQSALAKSGAEPHTTAIISGIGCASRLPYYMNTYGFHTIHGRAFPIATGLKMSRPDLDVWIITGDGDALSIGGNHYIHLFRRDIDVSILLFNNQIYGLTKGQYSPTSSIGQYSKTSPSGVVEKPLNALKLALTAGASFVARTFDRDAAHIQHYFMEAREHRGASLVEILQNCPIFNDGVFDKFIDKSHQPQKTLRLEQGRPLLFGEENQYAIVIENARPRIVESSSVNAANIWVHNQEDIYFAEMLSQFGDEGYEEFPLALGVIYKKERDKNLQPYKNYEEVLQKAMN